MGPGYACEEGARRTGAGYTTVRTREAAGTASRTECACESNQGGRRQAARTSGCQVSVNFICSYPVDSPSSMQHFFCSL
jgi:hypothetical protein